MKVEDLKYYISLVNKAVAQFENICSNFKRSYSAGKVLTNNIENYRKHFHKIKKQYKNKQITKQQKLVPCLISRSFQNLTVAATLVGQQPSPMSQDHLPAKSAPH